MIEADRISVRAGQRDILSAVSLVIEPGRVTGIVGPNGAGKSTILKAITGEVRLAGGSVRFEDRDMKSMAPREIALRRAVLPQSSSLSFPFTVHEVVRLGVSGPRSTAAVRERVVAALARVDLAGFGGRFFQELSGGEQQRVHLARVLCQVWEPRPHGRPNYLFLDEPTASLDLRHQILTLDTARDFARRGGGVVAILHDLNLAALYADHIIVVDRGTIAVQGTPGEVLTDEMLRSVFGVSLRVGHAPANQPFILPHSIAAA